MQQLCSVFSIASQLALAVLVTTFAGGRILQESDWGRSWLEPRVAGVSYSQTQVADDVAEASDDCECIVDDVCSCEDDTDYACMQYATLSPSMRKLEQSIGKMRLAGQSLASAAASDDGTLQAAASDYRESLAQAREVLAEMRIRMDDEATDFSDLAEENGSALIGRHGEIRYQADELRLLGAR